MYFFRLKEGIKMTFRLKKTYGLLKDGKSGEIHIFKWHDDLRDDFNLNDECICSKYYYGQNEDDRILRKHYTSVFGVVPHYR